MKPAIPPQNFIELLLDDSLPAMYQRIHRVVADLLVSRGFMEALAEPNGEAFSLPDTEKDRELLEFVRVQVAAAVEREQMHCQLEHMATYDQLTGLPNRRLFMDRIQKALERAARDQGYLAVLYLDLDNFKEVNDTYGHSAGDEVLRTLADRLSQSVRAADTVARLGGDEFIVLLDIINHPDVAFTVADKVRALLSEPYELAEASLALIPSIGVAVYPEHGEEREALIRHADSAMYRVKKGEN